MTTIEHLIGDLLVRHNCVIVPSFGGFVAKQISAKIDFDKGSMMPPRKSLLFNKQLINNDGLLINELSQAEQISFDEAEQRVSEKVNSWNHQLKRGKRIELDRVGMLFLDAENNLCFEQDRFFNLLLASFGLGQVHFLTEEDVNIVQADALSREIILEEPGKETTPIIELVQPVETAKPVTKVSEVKQPRTIKPAVETYNTSAPKKRRFWRYAAAACILPIAFYSIWIPMQTDVLESGVISIKDFNPFYSSSEGNYTQSTFTENIDFERVAEKSIDEEIAEIETDVDVVKLAFTEDTYIFVDISDQNNEVNSSIETVEQNQEQEMIPETQIDVNARHLIIGCFGNKENATNLVSKLKSEGMNAIIVDISGGLHRVSAGAAISDESLQSIRTKAEGLGYQGWVLK
ncbi:MAG: SPOR domain-containing protein [Crocinitomicaceae bacterium]|nr:SPOR domain-containing protein [Crocinitomicaceae bacterium]